MRPVEPDRQEKGLAVSFEALEQSHRFSSGNPVGVFGIRPTFREPAHRSAELSGPQREDPVVNLPVAAARIDGEVPGWVVVQSSRADRERHAVVIELPNACREPAVRTKELRERDRLRQLLAEMRRHRVRRRWVGEHTGGVRPPPRQQRRAARAAQRVLRVGAVEPHTAGRQLVDVRRTDRGTVCAEVVVQVVGDQEEHVEPRRLDRLRSPSRERHSQRSQANQFELIILDGQRTAAYI